LPGDEFLEPMSRFRAGTGIGFVKGIGKDTWKGGCELQVEQGYGKGIPN
jgi:hypothetical protein